MEGFLKLTSTISIHDPSAISETNCPAKSVSLVILCTWMGAAPRQISKYTDGYRKLFPKASILLIESSLPDMTHRSQAAQQERLKPACEVIASHLLGGGQQTVLHAFSNAGAQTATQLAERLQREHGSVPFTRTIFDSCPGRNDPAQVARAVTIAMPRRYFIRAIAVCSMHIWAIVYFFILRTIHIDDPISRTRRRLNDPALFPPSIPRLYLYSKADQMVGSIDIHKHALEAKAKGYLTIRETVFEMSSHCALVNEDREKYWNSVKVLAVDGNANPDFTRSVL
jgi:Eukaryotic protein of unknown function (DUF829)